MLKSRFSLLAFFVTLFFLFSLSFKMGAVWAANAIPDPKVPCTEEDYEDPEFGSLRPYQASPCRDAPKAAMCGNIVVVKVAEVETDYCGQDFCPYNKGPETQRVVINLSDVQLPILGNTQQTANSQAAFDAIDNAQKTNEYVSWYLAGADHKAEYGTDDITTIINFSGPLKKLLPAPIQDYIRTQALYNAGVKPDFTDPDTGETSKETFNHNQIAVCAEDSTKFFPLWMTEAFGLGSVGIGKKNPIPCYSGGGGKAQGDVFRLVDWWESKNDPFNPLFNWLGADIWEYAVPPFPWQFKENIYYQKAYQEWRGNKCIIVPFIKRLLCVEDPFFAPNYWSDLYPYVPLSNTVDIKGKLFYDNVHVEAPDATFIQKPDNPTYEIEKVPQLYVPHSIEVSQALNYLNTTFVPKEGVETGTIPANTDENTNSCQIIETRINPGDDLTFENVESIADYEVTYEVDQIKCKETGKFTNIVYPPFGTPIPPQPIYECKSDVYATINLSTVMPHLKDIWENSTAGAGSTFRKIFPKVEPGAPVSCLADIPGASTATFTVNDAASSKDVEMIRVENPGGSTATAPEIYFAHLGSVYDYFLKGIQTALRPKGFGEKNLTQGTSCTNVTCGELPTDLPKASGACKLGSTSSRVGKIPESLKDIISAAAEAYQVPPQLMVAVMFGESTFNTDAAGNYSYIEWTDENIKNWSSCTDMPRCHEYPFVYKTVIPFFIDDWDNKIGPAVEKEIQKFQPGHKANPCNLIDGVFGTAYLLRSNVTGGPFPVKSCYGIDLNTGSTGATSCSNWSDSDYETAIKVHESGYTGNCVTEPGSCATGGGTAAYCSTGGDTCETVSGSSHTSHNACVYDVAHGK